LTSQISIGASQLKRDSIEWYFTEIEKMPLLTKDQEKELCKRIKKGDIEARNKLVSANLRFVVLIACKYSKTGVSFDDMVGEGNLGLIIAAEKFNPDRGYKFISYAVWWIRQRISKLINENASSVRLPSDKVMLAQQTYDMENILSLDLPSIDLNYTGSLIDTIVDEKQIPLSESTERKILSEIINELFINLDEKEKTVLEFRFGINGNPEESLKSVGQRLGLTRERIRQIEKKALRKLIEDCKDKSLKIFIED